MNIWHDIKPSRVKPDEFISVIEIPKGCKNKYEMDKDTGMLILDRILYTSTHYPANYGFIPRTMAGDGDPLDVLVIASEPISSMSLVKCYPIGYIAMNDNGDEDIKIIAIPFKDPSWNGFREAAELPVHIIDEMKHFFTVYKQLENREMSVLELYNADEAKRVIEESIELYNKLFENNAPCDCDK